MKKSIVLIALLLSVFQCLAQGYDSSYTPFGNSIVFKSSSVPSFWDGPDDLYIPDTAIYSVFKALKSVEKDSYLESVRKTNNLGYYLQGQAAKVLIGVKLDPKLQYYQQESLTDRFYHISNNSEAIVVAMGINKNNVNDYRYHVVMNDSVEIVPWSIPKLAQNYGAKEPYGMIGKFKAPGKQLFIEVINIKDYSIRESVIFEWKSNYRTIVSEIGFYKDGEYTVIADTNINKHHMATRFDPVRHIPLDLKFRAGDVVNLPISVENRGQAPYYIYLVKKLPGQKIETKRIAVMEVHDGVYNFHNEHYSKPGKYELIIKSANPDDTSPSLRMPFEVLPSLPLLQKYTIRQMLPYIIGGLAVISLCFAGYYYYNKRKLRLAERASALASIQLKSVRSQLNPHFMFNALTSIQNLMNHNDSAGANHYLSKFADLTRHILNSSGQELISVEDELAIITDYLQMEQLRFGFEYTVEVDDNINKANTEIPAMLLQPFIENAAKHGVSTVQSKGMINVGIVKRDQDMILKVADNGPGFNTAIANDKGFGLKLSHERITLLNSIYKDQPIYLAIDSNAKRTIITITLTNWV